MLLKTLATSPTISFIKGLLNIRGNPFLLLMYRRDGRKQNLPLLVGLYVAGLAGIAILTAAGGPFLMSRVGTQLAGIASAGELASAAVVTLQFYLVLIWTWRRRYTLAVAQEQQALEHYRLIALPPAELAGMTRTYPTLMAVALCAMAAPIQMICGLQGTQGLANWPISQVFLILAVICFPDRQPPATSAQQVERAADGTPTKKKRGNPWIALPASIPSLTNILLLRAGRAARLRALSWVVFYPYLLPKLLVTPIALWHTQLPLAVPLLLIALPTATLGAVRIARSLHQSATTIRIAPWSLAGLGNIAVLTVSLGFLWPAIQAGRPARLIGAPLPDVSLSAEGVFAALMVAWAIFLVGGRFLIADGDTVTFGPLRSHHGLRGSISKRRELLWEAGWVVEAVSSLYVPLTAFCLAWLIGGDVPWPDPSRLGVMLCTAGATLASCWLIGRHGALKKKRGPGARWGWITPAILVPAAAGILLPVPLGRWITGFSPPLAALSCIPLVPDFVHSRVPFSILDLPSPAHAAVSQLLLAILYAGLVRGMYRALPRRESQQEGEEATVASPPTPTVELVSRMSLFDRSTDNPIALRLGRSKGRSIGLGGALGLSLGIAGLGYLVWIVCLMAKPLVGPSSMWAWVARNPYTLAIPLMVAAQVISVVMHISVSGWIKKERVSGAFGLACLTPLTNDEMRVGYTRPALLYTLAIWAGPLLMCPLLFLGTDLLVVSAILGSMVPWAVYVLTLALAMSFAEGLPRAHGHEGSGVLRVVLDIGISLGAVFLAIIWAGVAIVVPVKVGPHWACAVAPAVAIPLGAAAVGFQHWLGNDRLKLVRKYAIPQGPEPQLVQRPKSAA